MVVNFFNKKDLQFYCIILFRYNYLKNLECKFTYIKVGRKRKRELALKFKDKVTKKSKKEHYLHKFDIEQDDVNEFFEEGDQDDEDKN